MKEVVRSACRTALLEAGFTPDDYFTDTDTPAGGKDTIHFENWRGIISAFLQTENSVSISIQPKIKSMMIDVLFDNFAAFLQLTTY